MSDNWVVQNLENALEVWNEKLAEIWTLITQSPQAFKGGSDVGVIAMSFLAPLKKPTRRVRTMSSARVRTAVMQKRTTPERTAQGAMILKGPTLSETALGTMRPRVEAALKTATM